MPEPLRERQKSRRREALEGAALQLFRSQGLHDTTVAQIAGRAGLAKGTFFNYFDSKHDVLAQRLGRLAEGFLALADGESTEPPLLRLAAFFTGAEALFRAEGPSILTLYREVFLRPDLMKLDEAVERRIHDYYRAVLTDGVREGHIRSGLDLAAAATVIIDLWSSTLRAWILEGCGFSLAEAVERKLSLLFTGLRNRHPH
ncbi:MAG TPA: TetR/AcrR family transcriptional regulator [Caulobacteraceae bacterium]|jgi:AcrR family transcriptional regulator